MSVGERFITALQAAFAVGLRQHHALDDAVANRAGWFATLGISPPDHALAQATLRKGIMRHRHLNHSDLTLAAIDSIIERGTWRDWLGLARAVRTEAGIADKVRILITRRLHNPRDDELDRPRFSRWLALVNRAFDGPTVRVLLLDDRLTVTLLDGETLAFDTEHARDLADALFARGFDAEHVQCGDWREGDGTTAPGAGHAIAIKARLRELAK